MITEIELSEDTYHDTRDIGASSVRVSGDIDNVNRIADYARQLSGKQVASKEKAEEAKDIDMVNTPPHYCGHGIECIDEMVLVFGKEAVMNFCLGNCWKYRYRAPYKGNAEQDMEKSRWYLNKYKELRDSMIIASNRIDTIPLNTDKTFPYTFKPYTTDKVGDYPFNNSVTCQS